MKTTFFALFLLLLCGACNDAGNEAPEAADSAELKAEVAALEKELLRTGDATANQEAAAALVDKTEAFAAANPADESTPEMLFKAADVANGARNYGKAVQLWGQVWRKYPAHERAPMALFLQGFTFDSKLRDSQNATRYYQQFLKQYPNDSLTTRVQQLLSVVEVPPEQLIKQFQEEQ